MQKRYSFEIQLTRFALTASLPLLLLLLWVMVYSDVSIWLVLLTVMMGSMLVFYTCYRIYQKSAFQFRSLSNLLDAMIQGDYSLRARSDQSSGALDELVVSINGLAQRLSQQRSESVESQLLVRTVIDHIDVAIVALSEDNQIRFLNPAAKKLLLLEELDSTSKILEQLSAVQPISSGSHQIVELSLGHQQGRFNVHVEQFRESGLPHKLLFITDVRTLLRSEERKAWQSLVRVISHEINNSLSPIASISQTLKTLINREENDAKNNNDIIEGLTLISDRATGLSQFVESYKQIAKLPDPKKQSVSIIEIMKKMQTLFDQQTMVFETTTDCQLLVDPVQFEQVLINVFKNAIESMSQVNPKGSINIAWYASEPYFKLTISDQGGGVSNPENLFVPFYSTKKHGSGIGLVLCRQIIEAHNGSLSISNRTDSPGCCVNIDIPCQ